ncbi:MAG: hypothetical protein ACRDKG_11445 [Actinomycetota bacterium]
MKKRLALALAAAAATVTMLVPVGGSAAEPACIVVNGPAGLHLQLGYAPNGPEDCTVLPPA